LDLGIDCMPGGSSGTLGQVGVDPEWMGCSFESRGNDNLSNQIWIWQGVEEWGKVGKSGGRVGAGPATIIK
jgi:hypothetical protein